MLIGRSALAFLVAVAVAMLPVAGNAMLRASATGMSVAGDPGHESAIMDHDEVSAADMEMDCCPHQGDHSKKALDGCAAMAACGLCFTMAMSSDPLILFLFVPPDPGPAFVSYTHRSQPGHPPFRPPRA